MIDTPHIAQSPRQKTALIRVTIPRAQIQQAMGPGIDELLTTLSAQGIQPTGPVLCHHLKMDPATFDFEICVPVAADARIAESGRVKSGELRAARVARTVYHGGYEGLGAAWGEFTQWMQSNGHQPAEDLWESYLTGPVANADPLTWRTELVRPLTD